MQTQPQLLLLQKTMVVVEGVARSFNPRLNMWAVATPVVREWMNEALGPAKRLAEAASGAAMLGRLAAELPEALADARRTARLLSDMAEAGGLRLDRRRSKSLPGSRRGRRRGAGSRCGSSRSRSSSWLSHSSDELAIIGHDGRQREFF